MNFSLLRRIHKGFRDPALFIVFLKTRVLCCDLVRNKLHQMFSYPQLVKEYRFFGDYRRRVRRNLFTSLAKRNRSFRTYCFQAATKDGSLIPRCFDRTEYYSDPALVLGRLANDGIVVIRDFLEDAGRRKIIRAFGEARELNPSEQVPWVIKPCVVKRSLNVKHHWGTVDCLFVDELREAISFVGNSFYSKIDMRPDLQFHYHQAVTLPETLIRGDNVLHIDRFVPALKLFYAPFDIDRQSAPFRFVPHSHKIDRAYKNYTEKFEFSDSLELERKDRLLREQAVSATVTGNSLILVATNGIHGRSSFSMIGAERAMVFMQYFGSYRLSDLMRKVLG